MPAPRKVSPRQVELLVEFAETHTPIALGRLKGPQASQATRRAWESLAMQLNSLAEGTSKPPDQWRRYWIEFKARTKTKAADLRRNASSTGGGPSKFVPVTAMEERVLAIIGKVAVEGLPEVRIPISIEETAVPAANITEETAAPVANVTEETAAPVANVTEETAAPVANLIEEAALPTGSLNLGVQMEVECQEEISPPLPSLPPPFDITAQREERLLRKSSHVSFPSTSQRRSRISRPIRRDPNVPRWAYDLEMRRMDIEDRKTMILENISKEIQLLREVIKNNNNK